MRSISAFAAIVLVGTGSVNVQTAEASGLSGANLWAFLTADQPYSDWYIPTKSGQRSSTGLPASVARTDVGHYVVYMPNLAVKGGTVHVTPTRANTGSCRTLGWGPDGNGLAVTVACNDPGGNPVDATFMLTFARPVHSTADIAYVLADQPQAPTYSPSSPYSFNTAGGLNTVTRYDTGIYGVTFQGLGEPGGTVQITPFGPGMSLCATTGFGPIATTQFVSVECRDPDGEPVDSAFVLTYLRKGDLTSDPTTSSAYLWADNSTAINYVPSADHSYSSAAGDVTASGPAGHYTITLHDLGGSPFSGVFHVTSVGDARVQCTSVGSTQRGNDLELYVYCDDPQLNSTGTQFTLMFIR